MIARAAAAVSLACAALAAGCGSEPPAALPPAAEPASSPPATEPPAGRVVPVGNRPEGIAADPATGRFAVGLREPAVLALVDGASGAVERRVPLPAAPRHLQRDGDRVLVPAEDADTLVRVRFADGASERAPTGREPHDAAGAAGRVFVADEFANRLTVLEGDRPLRPIPTALQPGGVTPVQDGGLAVVAVRERVVELFDAATGTRLDEAPAGVGPTHAVADVNRLFVADTAGGAILVYRIRPELELTRRVSMPGSPYGLAIDHRRHRLFVTQTARNQLTELTAEGRPSRVGRYPTPRQPNSVAVDERTGRVAVTGKVDGVVQLLDPRDRTR